MTQRPDLENVFSFSRISSFNQCRRFYKHRYVDNVRVEGTESFFLLGHAYHGAQEHLYRNYPGREALADVITATLLAGLSQWWRQWFTTEGIIRFFEDFERHRQESEQVLQDLAWLEWRGTAACTDVSLMIRNRDGSIPKGVTMTTAYKKAYEALGMGDKETEMRSRGLQLSERVEVLSPTLQASRITLADIYLESFQLCRKYRDPGFDEIVGVELGFTGDKLVMIAGFPVQGFIDLVGTRDGRVKLQDHKTSREALSPLEVAYHEQMLLYVHSMAEAYGIIVDDIAINNAREGTVVEVPVDWDLVAEAVARHEFHLKDIAREQEFPAQNPFNKYTGKRCMGYSKAPYAPENLNGVCPYLQLCHPALHARLQVLAGMAPTFDTTWDQNAGADPAAVDAMAAQLFQ